MVARLVEASQSWTDATAAVASTSPLPNRTHTTESNTARYPKEHCLFVITLCCNRSPSVVTAASPRASADRALRSGAPTAAVRHPHRPNYLSLQRPSDSPSGSPQCSHFRQSAGAPGILTGTWPRCAHSSSSRACRVSYHRGPGGIGGQSMCTHLASARMLCLGSSVLTASSHTAVRMFWGVMCRTDSVPSDGACRRTATPAEVDLSPTLDGTDGAHSSLRYLWVLNCCFLRLSVTLERRVWLRFVSRWMAHCEWPPGVPRRLDR
jgi:hypothetical protein